jgi:O-antigen ligase
MRQLVATREGQLALMGWTCVVVAVLVGGTASGVALLAAVPLLVLAALRGRAERTGPDRTAWSVGLLAIALVCAVVGALELTA